MPSPQSAKSLAAQEWSSETKPFLDLLPGSQPWRIEGLKDRFYMPNTAPPGKGKEEDITQCIALFVDFDKRTIAEQLEELDSSGLPVPSVLVMTGNKGIHAYWLLSRPITPQLWRTLTLGLLEALPTADTSLKDPCRKMRLPGHVHPETGKLTVWTGSNIKHHPSVFPVPSLNSSTPMSLEDALQRWTTAINRIGSLEEGQGTYDQAYPLCMDLGGASKTGGWPLPVADMTKVLTASGAPPARIKAYIRAAQKCSKKNGGGLVRATTGQSSSAKPPLTERYQAEINALPPATPSPIKGSADPESPPWSALLPGCEKLVWALETVTWSAPQKPATSLALFLSACAACLPGPGRVEITSYWKEALNLFTCLVANSGRGKSFTLKRLTQYPLQEVSAELQALPVPELPGWKNPRVARHIISADSNNEGTLKQLEANEKVGFHGKRANTGALPLVVYADELHAFLSGLDRYHTQTGATNHADAILQWYDGDGASHTARADEDRVTYVVQAAYHFMGTIQWPRLTDIIKRSTGAGLWGRTSLIPFWENAPRIPRSADPGRDQIGEAFRYLKSICNSLFAMTETTHFHFSTLASDVAWERKEDIKAGLHDLSPIEQEIMGKSVGHECRLATVLHCVTSISQGITPPRQVDISSLAVGHLLQQYIDAFTIYCHTAHSITDRQAVHSWLEMVYPLGMAAPMKEILPEYSRAARLNGWPLVPSPRAMGAHCLSYGATKKHTKQGNIWIFPAKGEGSEP